MITYILSLVGMATILSASLIKGNNMKLILALVCLGNVLIGTSYLFEGQGINGAAASFFGSAIAVVNFFFDSKERPIPKWLIGVYLVLGVALNLWVAGGVSLPSVIIIATFVAFLMSIIQNTGAQYRVWTIANLALWCFYDGVIASYSVLITHGVQLGITLIGILLYDRKKQV